MRRVTHTVSGRLLIQGDPYPKEGPVIKDSDLFVQFYD